jgi:cell division transport system permease protein
LPINRSVQQAALGLTRHRTSSIVAVGTMAFMLSALIVFVFLVDGMSRAASDLQSKANLIADVRTGTSHAEMETLVGELHQQYPDIHITYVSRKQAVAQFKRTFAGQSAMLAALEGNPLPASIQITDSNPAVLSKLDAMLKSQPMVSQLIFNPNLTKKLVMISTFIKVGGIMLITGLALLALLIVVNTTHLTVEGRRHEIEVMKIVGATHRFVRDPLILEGIMIGLGGALLASALGVSIYLPTLKAILAGSETVALLPINTGIGFLAVVVGTVLLTGAGIGASGSYISVRRFANL